MKCFLLIVIMFITAQCFCEDIRDPLTKMLDAHDFPRVREEMNRLRKQRELLVVSLNRIITTKENWTTRNSGGTDAVSVIRELRLQESIQALIEAWEFEVNYDEGLGTVNYPSIESALREMGILGIVKIIDAVAENKINKRQKTAGSVVIHYFCGASNAKNFIDQYFQKESDLKKVETMKKSEFYKYICKWAEWKNKAVK